MGVLGRRIASVILFSIGLSSSGVGAGPVFDFGDSHLVIADEPKVKEDPKFGPDVAAYVMRPREANPTVLGQMGPLPIRWNMRITGADMAKDLLDHAERSPVTVVVMDDGIHKSLASSMEGPDLPPRTIRTSLLEILRGSKTGDRLLKDKPVDAFQAIPWLHFAMQMLNKEIEIIDPKENEDFGPKSSHGAHVSGIVGGHTDWYGTNSHTEIIGLDVFQGAPYRFREDTADYFLKVYELERENYIVNLSLNLPLYAPSIRLANRIRRDRNASLVFAAGNDGRILDGLETASLIEGTVIVGAFGPWGGVASFSNQGGETDILAPGVDIYSRLNPREEGGPAGYALLSGTSMAAPMVSGALANLRAIFPNAKAEDLERLLLDSAWDLEDDVENRRFGKGLVNIYKATRIALDIKRRAENENPFLSDYLDEEATYETKVWAKKAKLQRYRVPQSSEAYRRLLYQEVLLGGDITKFEDLSQFYAQNFNLYAEGLRFMSYNHSKLALSPEEVEAQAEHAASLQRMLLIYSPGNMSVFSSLRQPQLRMALGLDLHPHTVVVDASIVSK